MKNDSGIFRLLLVSMVLFLGFVGSVGAVTNVTGCGTLRNAGETYVLQNDISTSGDCFTIGADNIILDGASYSITGSGSGFGVYLNGGSGVTVKDLNVSGFWGGIYLVSSSNNTITNNNASNNDGGIYLGSSSNNILTGNTASNNRDGIYLGGSSNNTLSGNTMSANTYNFGMGVWDSSISDFVQTIDTTNTVDGKPIYYLVGVSDQVIDSSTNAGYVGVVNGVNVTVRDLTLTRNGQGVSFINTTNSSVLNVNASNNGAGISLSSSSNNTLTGNNASNNDWRGIWLESSSNNTLSGNTMSANTYNFGMGVWDSSISDFVQTIDTTNTVDGKPIYYLVGVSDQVIDSSTNAGYVGVVNGVNVTIRDLTLTRNGQGVSFVNTTNSSVLNVNASNNKAGIRLYYSSNNTITGNNASNNVGGIYLDHSSNNILTGNNASNNEEGIFLYYSRNNTLTGNNASNNVDGIYFDSSSNNILTGNNASNNGAGIYFGSSNNNTITDNTANSNNWVGISLSSSSSNTIYNNLFNNTNNFYLYSSANSWNTTKTAGINIVGGPYLGGNFWANPNGTGFSETCYDADGDGICDLSYTLTSGNVDFLPLTLPPVAGTNLYLSKQAPVSKDHGSTMTYTLYYHNLGDTAAQNVVLEDTLPAEVEFISASDSGSYDTNTGKVTWNLGSLESRGHGYENVTVRISQNTTVGTVIQNDANISTSTIEVRYDDNEAHAQTSVTASSLPPDAGVEPNNGGGGTPSVYYGTPITFSYQNSTATGVDIRIQIDDGGSDITGGMTGGPPEWTFTTTFYPRHGRATITYTVSGGLNVTFNIYIDPAGYIYDADTGERIENATVWLQHPDGMGGWEDVPTGEAVPIAQPDVNPQVTGVDGQYQWDVLAGSYRVHVEASGYYPEDSIVVSIPPPVTDLHVGLTRIPTGPTQIDSCTTITSSGVYVLNQDITNSSTCITIESSDVTFDGAGYSITGPGGNHYGNYGVYVYNTSTTLTNVTVRDVNVTSWSGGIFYRSVENASIANNTANSNNNYGIVLSYSSNNTLNGNAMNSNTHNFGLYGGQDSHFNNSIDTSNTVDGKPIYYVRNAANMVYNNSTNAGTFYCISCDNVTIKDLTLTKNGYGISFWSTNNSKIENINASNNGDGISLGSSNNNTITNNTANSNNNGRLDGSGIYLYSSSNYNNLTNNNASKNSYGIYFNSSSNNTISNNTINANAWFGITLYSSSNNNTLASNTVDSNNYNGIYLGSSSSNFIHNNFFNNTGNFDISFSANSWNTTKTPGTNIIGGSYLGGNFWAKPDGTGFSQICTDADTDGICDSNYTLTSGNVDFLPLSLNFVPSTTTTTSTTTTSTTTTSTTTTTVPSQTTVAIDNATAPPMGDTTVSMTIENVRDVGVVDITLAYDRSVVQVLNVTSGDFDFMDAAIDNANGVTRTGAMQTVNPGLNGSVMLANITLKAVGSIGQCSALNLSINELKAVGPPEVDISATVVNGMFCIEETTPPSVTNPSAHPGSIPEDTDNNPTCYGTPYSEVSQLNVTVTDDSGVSSVTANLSTIGGLHDQPMTNISDTWTVATNASIGSAIYNGTDYLPHYLGVNATDIYNNTNSSVGVPLTVIKNGDVNEDGETTLYDAMYLARNVLGKPGFETITPGVADVSGDCSKTLYDAMYLAKNVLGKPGFETLR